MTYSSLIWIVDDSPTQAAITQRALGAAHRYTHFADGPSAIEALSARQPLPDVILLDWVMPGLSGDEVCRFLRADPATRDIAIVILTASRTDTEDIVCALESGANDYVSKPFVTEELRARVGTLLKGAELKRAAELERRRITTVNELSRGLLTTASDLPAILAQLATAITGGLCDGCAVVLQPGDEAVAPVLRHRTGRGAELLAPFADVTEPGARAFATDADALAALPPAVAGYIAELGLRGLAVLAIPVRGFASGRVALTRDRGSEPFDPHDLAALATCLELVGLAVEAALRSAADRVATRFHQEMIGIVSHDLRTPLSAVSIGIELLRTGCSAESVSGRTLARIDNSVRRMTAIVAQLLDVTRAQIGEGIPLSPRATQLHGVTDTLDELRVTRAETAFVLGGDDIAGLWDPDRLGQAVSNLASNAVQYGRPGAPVRIELSREGATATIIVHNEVRAQPIPAALLRGLFDPFTRGDPRDQAGGLGLGLYIVSQIVRAHGGSISASSDASGTAFRIDLPIARGPE